MEATNVALAPFLKACTAVITLGVRSTLDSYSREERLLLLHARRIFFPTPRFVDIFEAAGRPTFPSAATYRYQRSRLNQQLLFQYLGWPHPRSRIYFGTRQKERILQDFHLPCITMNPDLPGTPVYLVEDTGTLEVHTAGHRPVIVREYIRWEERVRLLFVNYECLGAQRYSSGGPGHESFEPAAAEHPFVETPVRESLRLLRKVRLDDMLIEWGCTRGMWQTIEMRGPPPRWTTPQGRLNRHECIGRMVETGRL